MKISAYFSIADKKGWRILRNRYGYHDVRVIIFNHYIIISLVGAEATVLREGDNHVALQLWMRLQDIVKDRDQLVVFI